MYTNYMYVKHYQQSPDQNSPAENFLCTTLDKVLSRFIQRIHRVGKISYYQYENCY